jgi:hypothetical protein
LKTAPKGQVSAAPSSLKWKAAWFSASRFDQSPGHYFGLGKQGFVTAFDLDQFKFPKTLRHA